MADSSTSLTLLGLLQNPAEREPAWEEFVHRYHPKILRWCRQWGAQPADAEDVAQTVLTKLTERMKSFRYNPQRSFRAYLRTMTQRVWSDLVAVYQRGGLPGDQLSQLLNNLEAREDLERRLSEDFDQELLDAAIANVRQRVQPRTWEAFRLTAFEGLSGASAARRLDMPAAHVFVAKQRVGKLLSEVVQSMQQPPDDRSETPEN